VAAKALQHVVAVAAGEQILAAGAEQIVVAVAAIGAHPVGDAGDGDADRGGAGEARRVRHRVGEGVDDAGARSQAVEAVVIGDVAQRLRRGVEHDRAERAGGAHRRDGRRLAVVGIAVVAEQQAPQIVAGRVLIDRNRVGGSDRRFVDVGDDDGQRLLGGRPVRIGRLREDRV
jgi:hypothetical protein